jgi:hypothetical protein
MWKGRKRSDTRSKKNAVDIRVQADCLYTPEERAEKHTLFHSENPIAHGVGQVVIVIAIALPTKEDYCGRVC